MQSPLTTAVPRVVLFVLLFSGTIPSVTSRAAAAPFEIRHDTAYARLDLPITVGQRTQLTWELADEDMWLFVGSRSFEILSIEGTAPIGRLRSVDARPNPGGALGQTHYVFGSGDIAFALLLRLEDGSLHTLRLRGDTDRTEVDADEFTGTMMMNVFRAKVDRSSVRALGVGYRVTGALPYFLDITPDGDQGDRVAAAFGSIYFDDASTAQASRLGATAVPEPASVALVAAGLVGLALRHVRRKSRASSGA